ncbi:MAG: hypothetical protein M1286_00335 [Candidatus Marsarchaeota archaeon]|nr:hypothetical protein [Candidatus Marsarchaeota archaeon]
MKYTIAHLTHPLRTKARAYELLFLGDRFEEIFIRQTYGWIYSQVKPNTTLLDLGANVGDTAIFFSMHPFIKKVISYEPQPEFYKALLENTKYLPKVKAINKAINSSSDLNAALRKFDRIALKCDIEGPEGEIFMNANLRNVYAIEVEWHNNKKDVVTALKSKRFIIVKELKPPKDMFGVYNKKIGILCACKA